MRVILQRVSSGKVTVDEDVTGAIERGFVALVGIKEGDTDEEVRYLAEKTAHLRVFADDDGRMNLSALDVGAGVLVVSQFTLYADMRRGRRPGFTEAARPDVAEPLVDLYAATLRDLGVKRVESGIFGAMMHVDIFNDGPVTLILDSDELM
jgi:D-tyrosyl-tRNA(Tyr) deacylase